MKTNLKQFVVIAVILIFLWLASGLMIWKCVPSQERTCWHNLYNSFAARRAFFTEGRIEIN